MTDELTSKPLRVSTDGGAGPYLMVGLRQLPEIRSILDQHKVRYWVDREAESLNGKPAVIVVNINRGVDPSRVQSILDASS